MRTVRFIAIIAAIALGGSCESAFAADNGAQSKTVKSASSVDMKQIERGRYLVKIAGCNDCHTAGYAPGSGKVPKKEWLTGDALGWPGPWGTTYPVNLRTYMQGVSEDQWVKAARTMRWRPPKP